MAMANHLLLAALAFGGSFGAGTVHASSAADSGGYVGASAGRTDAANSVGETDGEGFSVHGGFRLHRNFALEAGYAELGSARFQYDCPAGLACVPEQYPVVVNSSYSRLQLALLGIVPLGERFDLLAKVGFAQVLNEEAVRRGLNAAERDTGGSPETVLGLGARMHLTPAWSLRLDWDRSKLSDADVDSYWFGVEYRFAR